MKITTQQTFEFDLNTEKARVRKNFNGAQKKRLLHLIDLVEQQKFEEFEEEYFKLPYDEEAEVPEQEYVANYKEVIMSILHSREYQNPYSCVLQGKKIITKVEK